MQEKTKLNKGYLPSKIKSTYLNRLFYKFEGMVLILLLIELYCVLQQRPEVLLLG